MLRLQLASDLHLAHREDEDWQLTDFIQPQPDIDALLLAGDIGNPAREHYRRFLTQCSQAFPLVLVTGGNHEAYGHSLAETDALIRQSISGLHNVHYLQCGVYDLPDSDVRVLGCTLWTEVPAEARDVVASHLNDYRAIYQDEAHCGRVTVEQLNSLHRSQRAWLEAELSAARAQAKRVLVLTHHLPSFALIHPKYAGSRLMRQVNTAFATGLDALFAEPVHSWVCGHTHTPTRTTINGVDVVVNPTGYPHERCKPDLQLVLSVPRSRPDSQTSGPTVTSDAADRNLVSLLS